MQTQIIELSYYPDITVNLFAPLSHINWSILLYSGDNNKHLGGRFDILVTNPILTLVSQHNITKISYNKKYHISNMNPFLLLKKYLHNTNIRIHNDCHIPFQGGLLGVFGYDLIRYMEESIPTIAQNDLLLPDMAVGLYKWAIITDHKLYKSYLVAQDNPKKILSWLYNQKYIYYKKIFLKQQFNIKQPWKSNINKHEYSKKFDIIKNNIILGNCYQTCLAQRFYTLYSGNEWLAFRHLLRHNHAPFSAFIRLPNKISILSLSPERFLKLHNSKIKTQPIKGTLPILENKQDNLQQIIKLSRSKKNQAENLMIVDLLRNDLGKVSIPGSIRVTKLFDIQSFSGVHHMVSTITGILEKHYSACDLLNACFPGGSITGAPKIQAIKLIEQLEPQRRNIWSGSIGYLSYCGNMDSNIAIRTLLTTKQKIFCSVGSGIIFDSKKDAEYQEIQDKAFTLLQPLLDKFY
ncbi:aminodeoxychorismate synthase component I [Candidatus Blochmannia ocreatus (nom. nud.)]|uniref:aminodeoxychorismate synthase n=1 Tax=Candidatus Blochmannia ocreatus (nom. nud.) TaxID=251538 RepID=A0ABY4SY83_9ENTR|nr:aminodeoxychorismate synthase component I [Candidatus Blochmannia ocreatus]URJ24942.1 aminodeoxychorismate synthase component I [Candidatus Blochmannia ocreatus]